MHDNSDSTFILFESEIFFFLERFFSHSDEFFEHLCVLNGVCLDCDPEVIESIDMAQELLVVWCGVFFVAAWSLVVIFHGESIKVFDTVFDPESVDAS